MSEWSGCGCSSLSAASSDIGESASTVAFSRELDILNHLVTIEVQDWLDKIIKDVIDALCCDSKCLKHRRTRYRQEEKVSAVSALEKLKKENPHATKVSLQKKLNQRIGNGKLTVQGVERWGIQKAAKKTGPKINEPFELAILDHLVFTSLEKVDDVETAVVVANVCYSHDSIRMAAELALKLPEFAGNKKLQDLKFTQPWVKGWVRRRAMRKRRITAQVKELPKPEDVQEHMQRIQDKIQNCS